MGIQINGQTDSISAIDGGLTVSGVDFTGVSAGTTSAPSISPTGDSNTGIFFPSPDTVAIAEGGVEVLRANSSGFVGVGTNNPTRKLDTFIQTVSNVNGSVVNSYPIAGFINQDSTNGFRGLEIGAPTGNIDSPVYLKVSGTGNRFAVLNSSNSESFTILNNGNTGIGTNNPIGVLAVSGGISNPTITFQNSSVSNTAPDALVGSIVGYSRTTGGNINIGSIDIRTDTSSASSGAVRIVTASNGVIGEKFRVDSVGRVTMPAQPFVAGGSAAVAVSGNEQHVWATSGFVFSNIGNHWNASTGVFTAPVDGVYYVSAGIRYSSVSVTPPYIYIYFLASYQSASGSPILLWSPGTESGGTYRPRFLTALMYCRANDTIRPRLYVPSGTITIDGGPSSQTDCFLNIYLLG